MIASHRTTVMITGVGGRSVGHQVLSALLLERARYRLIATDSQCFSFGLYVADERYVVPRAADPVYLEAIEEIIRKEQVQAILPGTQAELGVLAQARDRLAAHGCAVIASPSAVVDRCLDKRRLYAWLRERGYGVPRSSDADGWRGLATEVGFPLVAKPAIDSGGSRLVAILDDAEEVERYIASSEMDTPDFIFSEYVGSAETEYTVGVLLDSHSVLIDSIVLHRWLQGLSLGTTRVIDGKTYALSTGYSQGMIVDHSLIAGVCEKLVVEMGIQGPANIQLRLDGDDVKVFEVHPRFSGTTSIRAQVGFNEPDVLIRHYLNGETFGRLNYRRDVAAIRAFQSIIVPRSQLEATEHIGGSR